VDRPHPKSLSCRRGTLKFIVPFSNAVFSCVIKGSICLAMRQINP
jgi:hypothetical protein